MTLVSSDNILLLLLRAGLSRLPQIRGSCGWNLSKGSTYSPSSSFSAEGSAVKQEGHDTSYFSDSPGGTSSEGPMKDGRRHPLCGGEYLDGCDLGPYRSTDVGDGSCQQHLNTADCHYDGGEFTRPRFRLFVATDISFSLHRCAKRLYRCRLFAFSPARQFGFGSKGQLSCLLDVRGRRRLPHVGRNATTIVL